MAAPLGAVEDNVWASLAFPPGHWTTSWANNPRERLITEVKRRTDGVGLCPNPPAVIRPVGAVLGEQHEEWPGTRRYLSMESLTTLAGEVDTTAPPALGAVS